MKKATVIFAVCCVFLCPLVAHAANYCYFGGAVYWKFKLNFACSGTGGETLTPFTGRIALPNGDVAITGTCISKAGLVRLEGLATNTFNLLSIPFTLVVQAPTPAGPLVGGWTNAPFTSGYSATTLTRVACTSMPPISAPSAPATPDTAEETPGIVR